MTDSTGPRRRAAGTPPAWFQPTASMLAPPATGRLAPPSTPRRAPRPTVRPADSPRPIDSPRPMDSPQPFDAARTPHSQAPQAFAPQTPKLPQAWPMPTPVQPHAHPEQQRQWNAGGPGALGGGLDGTGNHPLAQGSPLPGWLGRVFGGPEEDTSALATDWESMLATIDAPVRHHRITVASLQPLVGRTTTTLGLGTALALHRRDAVTSIDACGPGGTLALRLGAEHDRGIVELLASLREIHTASDLRDFTSVARSRLEVLAAPPAHTRTPISAADHAAALAVLTTFRPMVLCDTPAAANAPVMSEVYDSTDALVVPAVTTDDGWRAVTETLNWWERHARRGRQLVADAVVVITRLVEMPMIDPAHPPKGRERRRLIDEFNAAQEARAADLTRALRGRVRAVVSVPFDSALAGGPEFSWDDLSACTQDAYLNLAHEVARGFPR